MLFSYRHILEQWAKLSDDTWFVFHQSNDKDVWVYTYTHVNRGLATKGTIGLRLLSHIMVFGCRDSRGEQYDIRLSGQ